jgi:hypothetical protein
VVSIVTHAQPAELVLALRASHVHAPLVFLNAHLALGARLGVKFEPNLGVIHTLVYFCLPLGHDIAGDWSVSRLHALETKIVPTLADNISLLHRWIDYSIVTVGSGTVLCGFVVRDKRLFVVFLIPFVILRV